MTIVQGRSLLREIGTDATEACIINESLMHMMGEESPVGKTIYFNHSDFMDSGNVLRVVGVVKDFHCVSMHRTIQPFLFRIYRPYYNYVFVRIDPADTQEALGRIEAVLERFAPGYPFRYRFLYTALLDRHFYVNFSLTFRPPFISAENAAEMIESVCPRKVCISCPVSASHNFAV